jgi:hypothetical protein
MDNYYLDQLNRAEENHNWIYSIKIKFYGTKGESNFLSLDKETYKKIKEILKGDSEVVP